MRDKNLISVVIPTHSHHGRESDLENLINSLLSKSNSTFIGEIIIVDNGCSIPPNEFKGASKKIKIISEPKIGLNNARNAGISCAAFDIVSFVDDDVVVSSMWAEGIVGGYAKNDVLCVGGPVLVDKRKPNKYPNWFSDYFLRFLLPPEFPTQAGAVRQPYYLIGANMSFRRNIFDKVGLFDAELDRRGKNLLSNGDIEFIMRIPAGKVWYEPQATVYGKIPHTRLTRRFMIRRLFWQGISDYITIKKRGLNGFYDRNEVFVTVYFLRKAVSVAKTGNIFEVCCMFIRQLGFKCGRIYLKINQGVGKKPTP